MAGAFTKRELFGGAMVAEVPEVFVDASDFRPVPSSQEVFVSSSTATDISIVFDILQRVYLPDIDACKEHFDDIIDGREGSVGRLFHVDGPSTEFPKLGGNIPTYIVQGTVSSPYHPAPPPTDYTYLEAQKSLPYTLLLMAIFRLEQQKTDLVVTVNCPIITTKDILDEKRVWHPAYDHPPNGNDGAASGSGVVDDAITLLKGVASTLEVRDWDLFSPED